MGFFTAKSKVETEKTNKIFIKCPNCNNHMIHKNAGVCNNCKNQFVYDIRLRKEFIEKISGDINKGYKNIEPYLSRYKLILENFEKIYYEQKYIPNKLELQPNNFEDLKVTILNNVKGKIEEKKKTAIHKYSETGETIHYRALKRLRDELLEMQVLYPEFIEFLTIEDLKDVLK